MRRTGVAVALIAFTAVACGGQKPAATPDRMAAYRAAVEQQVGHPVANWPAYVAAIRDVCKHDARTFAYDVAIAKDNGTIGRLRVDVQYMCPSRARELGS